MKVECYPVTALPHPSRLFLDYVEGETPLAPFFPIAPFHRSVEFAASVLTLDQREAAADLLAAQGVEYGDAARANLQRLRAGASAIVTGQQVGLFGGPLLTLLKAATAVRMAAELSAAGQPHVPIFWMATEDHDFAEVDHVSVPSRHALRRLQLRMEPTAGRPVGDLVIGDSVRALLDEAAEFLGGTPLFEQLQQWYAPGQTMAAAFAQFIAHVFAPWGLLVLDAAGRPAHALGTAVLRQAIVQADALHAALLARDAELIERGYHAQVLVAPESSLLFLLDGKTGARLPLRRSAGIWKAGAEKYSDAELLAILAESPERISPNALLRPIFQDSILPTTAYIGGPAEIAYFAQSQVLYERLLGRTTPILPRLSATLIEPATSAVLARHEVTVPQVLEAHDDLAQRLGARAMPVEGKQALARAGNALESELTALTAWMARMDEGLGRTALVSASKMRYQMNRLRRLAASFQVQQDESLRRHANALQLALFPERHPQERRIAGAYYVARYGEQVAALLVDAADSSCPGHKAIWLE